MAYHYFPGYFFAPRSFKKHTSKRSSIEPQQAAQDELTTSGMSNSRLCRGLKRNSASTQNNGSLFDKILNRPLPISSSNDELERQAEQLANGNHTCTDRQNQVNHLTSNEGDALPASQQRQLKTQLGHNLDQIRVHNNRESSQAAALLGAEAFTHGHDIYLSDRARVTDNNLLLHEAAHAVRNQDAIQRREATWFERRAWLGFFDHYLPRKFLNNYMDDTGNPITLTRQEMEDCNPVGVDIKRSGGFQAALKRLLASGGGVEFISCTSLAGAYTNGTLGNFTVRYEGIITVDGETGNWTFIGSITFIDYWDFNTGGGNRPPIAEAKVIVANALLPGSPFHIDSIPVPAAQTQEYSEMIWSSAAPVHVPDNLGRGALDIGVGGDVGGSADVAGPEFGVGGADVGTETGAQTNADL